jgi:CDP-diacylglycerol--glycerol-3-phosphate 3-phosphatidyltransferase
MTPLGLGWPNIVSVLRVLMVPFLVVLILAEQQTASYAAAGIFVAGAATDGLDGYLARRFGSTTRTGQWLDPLADKLLVASTVVTLTALDRFPLWAAVVILAREVAISILRVLLGLRGVSLPASRAAKMKTTLQLVAITLYILPLGSGAWAGKLVVLVVAVIFTVATGMDYVVSSARSVRRSGRPGAEQELRR